MNLKWHYKKIGEVMIVERGGSPRPIKKYLTDSPDGLNWIKIGDASASGKYIYETKEKITKEGLHKTRFVNKGDFLLSNSMSFGRPYIMGTTGCIHDGWLVLREKEDRNLDKDFLYYLLGSPYIFGEFDRLASGSTVRNLNIGLVSSVEIPIPPLTEQKKIVAILDKAFAAIDQAKANIEKNIQNAQELFQSKLNEIFSQKGESWEEKNWQDVLEIRSGRNQKQVENPEGKYPILGSAGKTMGFADDYICEAGTTIIGRKGTINNPMYIETKFWNVDTAFGLHSNEELNKKFLFYFCLSYDFTQRDKGSGRPSLVKKDLLTMKMPIPSFEVQKEIVETCENLQKKLKNLEKYYQDKSNVLEELKKSILQKAFAGELT